MTKKTELCENEVRKLAELGCTIKEIADFFQINPTTIYDRFKDVVDEGFANCKMSIRRERMIIAMDRNHPKQASMLMFLSKVFLGEKEYAVIENADKTGPKIKIEFVKD